MRWIPYPSYVALSSYESAYLPYSEWLKNSLGGTILEVLEYKAGYVFSSSSSISSFFYLSFIFFNIDVTINYDSEINHLKATIYLVEVSF